MTAAELIAAGGHLLLGLGYIALALFAVVWTLMWIAFLGNEDRGQAWTRREMAVLFAPFVPIGLVFAYYLGGGR